MASILQGLINTQLTGAPALLYEADQGVAVQVLSFTATNMDVGSHTVTFYLVPSGAAPTTAYIITPSKTILSLDTFNDPNLYGKVLNSLDSIWGVADAPSVVNIFAAGLLSPN